MSTLVFDEWLRRPRLTEEIEAQGALLPWALAVLFGLEKASVAGGLYRTLRRPRGRELDLAVAACALTHGAALWTLNPEDFRDIPGLLLV